MKKHWHIGVIGVLTLVWNSIGAFDYVMTQTKNDYYMAQFTPEQLAFFYGFPIWVKAAWAVAVWCSVIGSILLLLRSKRAAPIFGMSLLGMVITSIHNFLLSDVKMYEVVGTEAVYFTGLIFIIALGLWLYARRMVAKEILR